MTSGLLTLLQLALSLLVSVQGNASLSSAQRQEAIAVATQATQFVSQTLLAEASAPASSSSAATAPAASGLPVRLVIPKLNIAASFQYEGLTASGTMETPSNVYDVGWYTGSALPGAQGVSIVIGHVAQIRKSVVTIPGVFSDLGALVPGDTFYVVNDRGATSTFVVRESRSYDPTADATDVFTDSDGGAHLNFITCEGTWDQSQLEYTQRLVVFADAVQ